MAKFTLLELHLDDAEFTANAPYSEGESDEDADGFGGLPFGESGRDEATESTDDGGASPFGIVVAFAGLVLFAVAVRRVLGGSGEPVLETAESEGERGGLRARL
jgi:hypothetical protein